MPRALKSPSDQKLTEEQRCGALLASDKTDTRHCRNMKGSGTAHPGYGYCAKHGGNTEAVLKSSAREAGRDLIKQFKEQDPQRFRFGGDRRDPSIASLSPELALVEEVRRSAAMVRFLEQRIGEWGMDLGDPTLELFVSSRKFTSPVKRQEIAEFVASLDETNEDSPRHLPDLINVHPDSGIGSYTNKREWLFLYREERMHLARTAKMALDAGVAQRLVTLAEDQGRILSSALRMVLQALNLTPEQRSLVPVIVPAILRAVANDQPLPDLSALLPAPAPQHTTPASSGPPYALEASPRA